MARVTVPSVGALASENTTPSSGGRRETDGAVAELAGDRLVERPRAVLILPGLGAGARERAVTRVDTDLDAVCADVAPLADLPSRLREGERRVGRLVTGDVRRRDGQSRTALAIAVTDATAAMIFFIERVFLLICDGSFGRTRRRMATGWQPDGRWFGLLSPPGSRHASGSASMSAFLRKFFACHFGWMRAVAGASSGASGR